MIYYLIQLHKSRLYYNIIILTFNYGLVSEILCNVDTIMIVDALDI